MKSTPIRDVVSQYALRLRSADPKAFEAFVEAFDAYATQVTVAVTDADQSSVLNCQGRAQAFLSILKMLRECHIPPAQHQQPPSSP